MTLRQKERAKTLINDLSNGVLVRFVYDLSSIRDKNSPSVIAHGREFTDFMASWIKKVYVAGPFRIPPLDIFQSNSMLAIEQSGKVHAIMNMSSPLSTMLLSLMH
jgi:hypothetical protein